jgi:2-keto-4-pentenoate hydratase/2-oxohepta-3-ene-1,7-dioic acid hydratase in catechol pathway
MAKILRYIGPNGLESYGLMVNNIVIDRNDLERELNIKLPEDILSFISSTYLKMVLEEIGKINFKQTFKLEDLKLLAPIPNPPKILCLGLNYIDHAEEQQKTPPDEPMIFIKPKTSIAGPYDDIYVPSDYVQQLDYEGELAVIIGKLGKRIDASKALDYVLGYTVFNDLSARDIQAKDKQWTRGKSLDQFAPIGPWIVTRDEVENPYNLKIITRVNGEIRQNSSTSKMVHKIDRVIEILSKGMTLEPGDIIATGTPSGVGVFMKPKPKFLKHGDIVEIMIEKIGTIRNRIIFT